MPLLIDAYNVIYAGNITGEGARKLEHARRKLVALVAEAMALYDEREATVVFDAAGAPPGLPRSFTRDGVQVLFAPRHEDADALLERLILAHHAPRKLTVVSSDHRVQRAAKKRRCKAIDSEAWLVGMQEKRASLRRLPDQETKPAGSSEEEVAQWLDMFNFPAEQHERKPRQDQLDIFPPGYAEDIGPDG